MGVKVTGQFEPAGNFSIVDAKDVEGNITGSNFSGSLASTGSFGRVEATKFSGDGSGLTSVFEGTTPSSSISTRLTTEEANIDTLQSKVGQSLNTTDSPQFAGMSIDGDLIAQRYIVSSSVSIITSSFSSGSTIFGDSIDDTHLFTGSLFISGNLTAVNITADSSSISTRLTTEEANVDALQTDSASFSTRVTNLVTDSASFSTRITTAEDELENTIISASAQISSRSSTNRHRP